MAARLNAVRLHVNELPEAGNLAAVTVGRTPQNSRRLSAMIGHFLRSSIAVLGGFPAGTEAPAMVSKLCVANSWQSMGIAVNVERLFLTASDAGNDLPPLKNYGNRDRRLGRRDRHCLSL
jgi:hypothetical protein